MDLDTPMPDNPDVAGGVVTEPSQPSKDEEVPQLGTPDIADNFASRTKYMSSERRNVLQLLAVQYKKNKSPDQRLINRLRMFLLWLDTTLEMTPSIAKETRIGQALGLVINPEYKFPEVYVKQAQTLLNKWDGEKWGKNCLVEDVSEEEEVASPIGTVSQRPSQSSPTSGDPVQLPPPPLNHPIFGEKGIMHGVVIRQGRNISYRLNVDLPRRNAKVFGNNGLTVGDWWPIQLVALFNGAHGSSQGGIAGDHELGTFSIVVAGTYHDLDDDEGETLYYSGSKSHENTDPTSPGDSTQFTHTLKRSIQIGYPVRVLRKSTAKSSYAPSHGIRYDGLYRVVDVRTPVNTKGGLYEQFELRRLKGQRDLKELYLASPTAKQIRDFKKIKERY